MSDGEPSFGKRLEQLACELAAAGDIAEVLAIRAEVMAIMATLRAQVLRGQGAVRALSGGREKTRSRSHCGRNADFDARSRSSQGKRQSKDDSQPCSRVAGCSRVQVLGYGEPLDDPRTGGAVKPVTLPPGRAMLATKPSPTGSATLTNNNGYVPRLSLEDLHRRGTVDDDYVRRQSHQLS